MVKSNLLELQQGLSTWNHYHTTLNLVQQVHACHAPAVVALLLES
jgi:hypothetical protein